MEHWSAQEQIAQLAQLRHSVAAFICWVPLLTLGSFFFFAGRNNSAETPVAPSASQGHNAAPDQRIKNMRTIGVVMITVGILLMTGICVLLGYQVGGREKAIREGRKTPNIIPLAITVMPAGLLVIGAGIACVTRASQEARKVAKRD